MKSKINLLLNQIKKLSVKTNKQTQKTKKNIKLENFHLIFYEARNLKLAENFFQNYRGNYSLTTNF